mgnify:CR=1 FL=1
MNINIFRRRFTPWSVDGTMVIGGKIFCDTLERPNRHLPAGRYKISLIPTKQKKVSETKKKNKYERGKYEIVIKPVILLRSNYVPRTVRRRARFVPWQRSATSEKQEYHSGQVSLYRNRYAIRRML